MNKSAIVKKHNKLIEGYAEYMDVRELRLIAQTAARITTKDKDFQKYQIPIKSISESNKNIYEEIRDVCEKLMKRIVKVEGINQAKKRQFTMYNIFSSCRYEEGTGFVLTEFHPDLKPYFLELKNNFTQFNIETLMRIPSTYSYRLYELLKQYQSGGIYEREFEITDLQEKLNINSTHAPSYRRWGDFVKRVLKPAQKHFKKYTDLTFEYEAWAEYGRKFTHIKFKTSLNRKKAEQLDLPLDFKPKQATTQVEAAKKLSRKELKILAEAGNKHAEKELKRRQKLKN